MCALTISMRYFHTLYCKGITMWLTYLSILVIYFEKFGLIFDKFKYCFYKWRSIEPSVWRKQNELIMINVLLPSTTADFLAIRICEGVYW